ncbi:MAG: hypothetical protein CMN60_21120 [Sphingobium sp.]|nr:hypothetical protein [Sphingobium sp.]MBS50133.1 hypothetical protein [Sphingobium sp.]|tara:strand:- start:257431 stop:258015 length:585 start_codon:yes stop_codon:yes gene_type:complete
MQVNLKKASALAKLLSAELHNTDFAMSKSISLDSPEKAVQSAQKASDSIWNTIEKIEEVTAAMFFIRKELSLANAKYGINVLLSEYNEAKEVIKMLQRFDPRHIHQPLISGPDELDQRIKSKAERTNSDEFNYRSGTADVVIMSEDHVSRIKDIINLKKRRLREIDEELLELNLANKITLSDDVIDTLREFEIV